MYIVPRQFLPSLQHVEFVGFYFKGTLARDALFLIFLFEVLFSHALFKKYIFAQKIETFDHY